MATTGIAAKRQEERDKESFLQLWRGRHANLRHACAVDMLLRADPDGKRQGWIDEHLAAVELARTDEQRRLVELRRLIVAVSPMLLAACDADGISVAAVAYGVLPTARMPLPGDGHPWLASSSPERRASVRASYHSRMIDGWEARHHADGAFVRTREHPAGRWAVRVQDGVLHIDMENRGAIIQSSGRHCTVEVPGLPPAAALSAAKGRTVDTVIGHPLLGQPAYVVTSATQRGERVVVRFRCAPVPFSLADLKPEPGREWQQLGRDGSLDPEDATADMIERLVAADPRGQMPFATAAHERAAEHLRRINIMAPPWVRCLAPPSRDAVAAILEKMRHGPGGAAYA